MGNYDYDDYEDRSANSSARKTMKTVGGALVSAALLAGVILWGYRLGVRDANGVPVIAAMSGPTKIAPADPGGAQAAHQNEEVYQAVTGEALAVNPALAPAPERPTSSDMTDLQGQIKAEALPPPAFAFAAGSGGSEIIHLDQLAPKPGAAPTLAETPPVAPQNLGEGSLAAAKYAPVDAPVQAAAPAQEDLSPSNVAPLTSTAPQPRPATIRTAARSGGAAAPAATPERVVSINPGSVDQIQLGAFASEAIVRERWSKLRAAHLDVLGSRNLEIQSVRSGGKTLYRLRVGPFGNRAEAAKMCTVLKARGVDCIVARRG